jgi:hypothetical protein
MSLSKELMYSDPAILKEISDSKQRSSHLLYDITRAKAQLRESGFVERQFESEKYLAEKKTAYAERFGRFTI